MILIFQQNHGWADKQVRTCTNWKLSPHKPFARYCTAQKAAQLVFTFTQKRRLELRMRWGNHQLLFVVVELWNIFFSWRIFCSTNGCLVIRGWLLAIITGCTTNQLTGWCWERPLRSPTFTNFPGTTLQLPTQSLGGSCCGRQYPEIDDTKNWAARRKFLWANEQL